MVFGVSTCFVGIAESDRTLSSKQLIHGSSVAFRFLQLQMFFCFKDSVRIVRRYDGSELSQ
jgi:hypothetical protein